jgi:uncharacterized protein (DUF1800 family)
MKARDLHAKWGSQVQDHNDSAANVAGPVAGGAAIIGGAAAVNYTADPVGGSAVFSSWTDALPGDAVPSAQAAPAMSRAEASRFLHQASMGPTASDINFVARVGIGPWLTAQYATGRSRAHWDFLKTLGASGLTPQPGIVAFRNWDSSIWRQLITAPDQLRQRVGQALLDIMPVSVKLLPKRFPQWAMAAYMDLLLNHSFGNFRGLLGALSTSSAMGQMLTYLGSCKGDASGSSPDENYARELMQLFTIGLYELDVDGTIRPNAAGEPIETYSQQDVSQLARVFTGLRLDGTDNSSPETHRKPLIFDPANNERGSSTFLGRTVSGGGMSALNAALNVIFQHPNVPPFVAKALIQRLTTSNPSPGYIRRVALRFIDNGSGVRGDMKAVITSILTDYEARSTQAIGTPHMGRLRDPTYRLTSWARAFGAVSEGGGWPFKDVYESCLHEPGYAPSIFNFFRPGYSPPNSELQRRGLVAPELQITDEQTVFAYLNYIYPLVRNGRGDIRANYSAIYPLAKNPAALVDEINILLAAGQLTQSTKAQIISVLRTLGPEKHATWMARIWTAVMLTMASPDYLVLQ